MVIMIRKRKGSKGNITYQVYIRYTDKYGIKKSYCKSGFQGLRLVQLTANSVHP